jgi:hypothetical protein
MPEHATVATDDDTKLEAGIWRFETTDDDDADDAGGQSDNDDDDIVQRAGLTFLDEARQTVLRIVDDDSDRADAAAATRPTRGSSPTRRSIWAAGCRCSKCAAPRS